MNAAAYGERRFDPMGSWKVLMQGLVLMLVLSLATFSFAAPPPAGTPIGNQSAATYNDASGTNKTVTSNTVQTTVTQVASETLVASQNKTAAPGSTVYYPHTVTNTGNGTDSFTLSATQTGAFTMGTLTIYADNGSGQPTGAAIVTTGALAAGANFRYVIAATVPNTGTSGQTNTITTTATSAFSAGSFGTNADVTTISNNAVVNVTKSISAPSGAAGSGPYVYTLTYTNTGNNVATAVRFVDALPAGMTYVAGSGRWSVTGATALTDGTGDLQGTAPNTIDYSVTAGSVTATVAQVVAGQSAAVTFNVTVAAGTAPGNLNNTASLSYNDGTGTTINGTSNTTPFQVTQGAAVALTGQTIASATPGSTVAFTNVVTNNGNGVDSFNLTEAIGTFPAGTTFTLFKTDGVTPLTDTNADGIPDSGPIAAGASYSYVVKAILPATPATGPFTATARAASTRDSTVFTTASDILTAETAQSVDIANQPAVGNGPGPEAAPVLTVVGNPGTTFLFPLLVSNTGTAADNYDLAFSQTAGFASNALPTGWTLVFRADSTTTCTGLGSVVANSGQIAAAGSARFCAIVTVLATGAGAAAGNTEAYFRARSGTSGSSDIVHDRATVSPVRSLAFSPSNSGQVAPAGSVVYQHTLTNNGNVTEGNGTLSTTTFANTNTSAGFTSVEYYDSNGNGILDAADQQIPASGLAAVLAAGIAPGQSVTIFEKVYAPSGAVAGDQDTTTVSVTTTLGTNGGTAPAVVSAVDSTLVVVGNLQLVKEQALDTACNGTGAAYTQGNLTAASNTCIRYRVTATNIGTSNVTSVIISDATPAYTTYDIGAGAAATTVGTITAPASGAAGSVSATVGTLAPGAAAVVTFSVRIQP